jgi:hypothetical protein
LQSRTQAVQSSSSEAWRYVFRLRRVAEWEEEVGRKVCSMKK